MKQTTNEAKIHIMKVKLFQFRKQNTSVKGLTIRARLLSGFSVLLVLMVAMTALAALRIRDVGLELDDVVNKYGVRERALLTVRDSVFERGARLRDISLLNDGQEARIEKALGEIKNLEEKYQVAIQDLENNYKTLGYTPEERKMLDSIIQRGELVAPMIEKTMAWRNEGLVAKARSMMIDQAAPVFDEWQKTIAETLEAQSKEVRESVADAKTMAEMLLIILISTCATGIIIGFMISILITKQINRALGAEPAEVRSYADDVGHGKLYTHEKASTCNANSIMASVADMSARLREIIVSVRESSAEVLETSERLNEGNILLSARTEQQASAITQTAAAMEQLGTTVRQNTHNARDADRLSSEASGAASNGGAVVQKVVNTMHEINAAFSQVSEIVAIIENIAFQTNILALNAAVEAARAGEQGKGFAVVANEVRSLSQRSAASAKTIKDLIAKNVEHVNGGVILVDQAGEVMQEIVDAISKVSHLMTEISSASDEQSKGVEQVGEAIRQLDVVTRQNSDLALESKGHSLELSKHAENMSKAVSVFQIEEKQELQQS